MNEWKLFAVNCAGIAPAAVGNMVELPEGLASKILRVNLMSNIKVPTRLTRK